MQRCRISAGLEISAKRRCPCPGLEGHLCGRPLPTARDALRTGTAPCGKTSPPRAQSPVRAQGTAFFLRQAASFGERGRPARGVPPVVPAGGSVEGLVAHRDAVFEIDSRHAARDIGQELGREGADGGTQLSHGEHLVVVLPEKGHGLAGADALDAGDIHHHLIHADGAHHRRTLSVDQDAALIGHAVGQAVGIADGHYGDGHAALHLIGTIITDFVSALKLFDLSHAGLERNGAAQARDGTGGVGLEAVEQRARAHGLQLALGVEGHGAGIAAVGAGQAVALLGEGVEHGLEVAKLHVGKLGVLPARGGEVGKDAVDFQALAGEHLLGLGHGLPQLVGVVVDDAQPAHARVNLDVALR